MMQSASSWIDQFGRQKRKLRISVTDRCNFKCLYCMPEHPEWMDKHSLLSFEALYAFCQFMVERGIDSLRITGGEPLMRQGVVHFIEQLQSLRAFGLKRIAMTSNGHYLPKYAHALKQAGLDDLNISLDSLDPVLFQQLTQRELAPVLAGIAAAQQAGLSLKINTVLMQGINDSQILPLVAWAKQQQLPLRFIEYMPLDGDAQWQRQQVVTEQQILQQLGEQYQIEALPQDHSPARIYRLDQSYDVGIISTISHAFCGQCDRIRLTAQGELFNCLFAPQGIALKCEIQALAAHSDVAREQLQQRIGHYIWHKAAGFHAIQTTQHSPRKISMHMLGG
ncbi:GTP 3',8-cyclase MoaA [Acinetobacter brisouii]